LSLFSSWTKGPIFLTITLTLLCDDSTLISIVESETEYFKAFEMHR
jgi:hypothetical protein